MSDGDELDDLLAEVVVPPASGKASEASAEKGPALPSSSSSSSPATARSSGSELSREELESIRGLVEVAAGMMLELKDRGIWVRHPAGKNFPIEVADRVHNLVKRRGLPRANWDQVKLEEVEVSRSGRSAGLLQRLKGGASRPAGGAAGSLPRSWFPLRLREPLDGQGRWLALMFLVWLVPAFGVLGVMRYHPGGLLYLEWFRSPVALWAVVLGLVAPLLEELVFRGVLYSVAEKEIGRALSIALVAVVYPLVHSLYGPALGLDPLTGPLGVVVVGVFGALWTYLRGMSGSIVPSVLFHVVHQVAFFGLGTLLRGP